MKIMKSAFYLAPLLVLTSCYSIPIDLPYQKAVGWKEGGQDGFLDKKIAPGVYIVEVQQINSGLRLLTRHDETIALYKKHWHRRSKELCPSGYIGGPKIIQPYQSQIDAFRCEINLCNDNVKMLSGTIKCGS